MMRDMDLIRDLLIKIENGQIVFKTMSKEEGPHLGIQDNDLLPYNEARKLRMHLDLIEEAGLVPQISRHGGGHYHIERMTWEGYEFIETLRDPDRWEKTKSVAAKAGGVGLKAMLEIGKSIAKGELQKLGIPLG